MRLDIDFDPIVAFFNRKSIDSSLLSVQHYNAALAKVMSLQAGVFSRRLA